MPGARIWHSAAKAGRMCLEMARLHRLTGLRRRLQFLRPRQSRLTPLRLKTLLTFAGFRFEILDSVCGKNLLIGWHPLHPAVLQLDMVRSPVPRHLVRHALDTVEELLALGVEEKDAH